MNKEFTINPDACFSKQEQKASQYFQELYGQVAEKTFIPILTKDFAEWKHNHIQPPTIFSLFSRRKGKEISSGYQHYIHWLNQTGKLDNYLDRSVSYLYMRDLGKSLESPETLAGIRSSVESLKKHLTGKNKEKIGIFSMAGLYRFAEKEGIEPTMIWLMDKLKSVSANIPAGMDAANAQRKLIKIIAGVIMHVLDELEDGTESAIRSQKLSEAIKLGFSYGLTYPFIDDLFDAKILSSEEEKQYSHLIRTALTSGNVPELGEWLGDNAELIFYIHAELREAFEYIKANQREEMIKPFLEQAYVFFHSQEVDRHKNLSNRNYTNEDLFIPVILKSSSSRLIVRSVISAQLEEGFESRSFFYGIYNQLADDFADMFDDWQDGSVTPYTYYMKHHGTRSDLINPYELYWTVISHLIHNVYNSDRKTCEVILDRAINGLKRFKKKWGTDKYNQTMELFASAMPEFDRIIQKMVKRADDVDFFDKLLRDHMVGVLQSDRAEQEQFFEQVKTVRSQINSAMTIESSENSLFAEPLTDGANYSLNGDGKRLRPIMTWFMGVHGYGLDGKEILPLLRSLEYMHTASLIFDDLPSQDNANIRRGRQTLHQVTNIAVAELTGLFLTQKAVEEQTSLSSFDPKTVLRLIEYSSKRTADMCKGQAMDLDSKGKILTLDELDRKSFYKTGMAFEVCLMMPAILAKADEAEMDIWKKFSYHAGIAFQIKDDLLDVEGDTSQLGKQAGIDADNNQTTFVSILGIDGAKMAMWEHYCLAVETLEQAPRNPAFLKHLLNYFVNRDR
ncbi:polyprenyl synthetase family protein [Niallia taxi]|nr:polyprenyl synthetase family protein [Niallia taxi]MDE5055497.1 polyprenyl synthetase family protein [Niallia taxi]